VLLLLTAAVVSKYNGISIIALEEVENSIHPKLMDNLLSILRQLAGDCRIIVTSHSPYILQYMGLDDVYIGLPVPCGKAVFRTFSKKGVKEILYEARERGVSVGDVIFDAMSGSQDDLDYLESCLVENDCTECLKDEHNSISADPPCRRTNG